MRKNFGAKTWLYPMPVLIIGSYDGEGRANAMTAAWGGIYDTDQIIICLSPEHKSTQNILHSGAFTVSVADAEHVAAADYVGLVSGHTVADKVARAGFTTEKSTLVNAPIICELPLTLECRLLKVTEEGCVIGEIVNVSADERVLADDGLIDPAKLRAISFDPVRHNYLLLGESVAQAFAVGRNIK